MKKINIDINIEEENWVKLLPEANDIIKHASIATLCETKIIKQVQSIEISVLLTNDEFIQKLNCDYRNQDKPTNVLSFPLENFTAGEYADLSGDMVIGDMIFALETILSESEEQGKYPVHHLAHLAVHSLLHLIGYDHETDEEAQRMEALETKVLAGLGIADPYQELS